MSPKKILADGKSEPMILFSVSRNAETSPLGATRTYLRGFAICGGPRARRSADGDAALLEQLQQKPQRVLARQRRNVERFVERDAVEPRK